jgi:hypothetical protein
MKWTYLLTQKIKVAISLSIIILMVLLTNFLSKRHFSELQRTFLSVYEDRLLVEVHIFRITSFLNDKNILLHKHVEKDDPLLHQTFPAINDSISDHIEAYEITYLTDLEAEVFAQLKKNIAQLTILEDSILSLENMRDFQEQLIRTNMKHALISANLFQLSNIQMEEGERLINKSKQIVASSRVTLQLELAILIIIGLVVQILIFSSKSTIPNIDQNSRLN